MRLPLIVFCLSLTLSTASAQDNHQWWNAKHNWDGVTPWPTYLTTSPGFMGPNALPVPETKTGLMPGKATLDLAGEGHYSRGDKTQNLYTELFLPLGSDRAGLSMWMVPIEKYWNDTITRDLRASRDFDGKGYAVGDVYLGTYIQIVKDKKYFPDLLLTINMRTASGQHFDAARFSDAPGYFFDLSFGKTKTFENSFISAVRPYAMGGFHCWQTHTEKYFQDDAAMYGLGFYLDIKNLRIDNSLDGYMGYQKNGDQPMVYRLKLQSQMPKSVNYKLMFEEGLHDFPYTSVRVGLSFDLGKMLPGLLPVNYHGTGNFL